MSTVDVCDRRTTIHVNSQVFKRNQRVITQDYFISVEQLYLVDLSIRQVAGPTSAEV